jgi:hypothetical protein
VPTQVVIIKRAKLQRPLSHSPGERQTRATEQVREREKKKDESEREKAMGAYCSDDVFLSPMHSFASSQDIRLSKHVHDNVHGNIYLDPVFFIYSSLFLFS